VSEDDARVEGVVVEPYRLALRAPLVTARGPIGERRGWIVRLRWDDGVEGVGEAAPLPGFGGEMPAEARAALEKLPGRVGGARLGPAGLDALAPELEACPSVAAAVDFAVHDAAARRAGTGVSRWLVPGAPRSVAVCALLADAAPDALARRARRLRAEGWTSFKLKVGARGRDEDLDRARAVRAAVGGDAALRLDANRAWRADEAARALDALVDLRPEWVEEPLADGGPDALAALRRRTPVPIAADESLRREADAVGLATAEAADVWVLKPAWLGGLRPALRVAAVARTAGVACAVTTALDAAVGRAAALHLAAALGDARAAGLDTGRLLGADVAALSPPARGRQTVPTATGLGVRP
jgi:o-succinylbenzoate synthase